MPWRGNPDEWNFFSRSRLIEKEKLDYKFDIGRNRLIHLRGQNHVDLSEDTLTEYPKENRQDNPRMYNQERAGHYLLACDDQFER